MAKTMFRSENLTGRSILAATLAPDLERLINECSQQEPDRAETLLLSYPEERTVVAHAWKSAEEGRVYLSLDDITELRRLERIRQDFVANVSHELRTPLASIRAMAETLTEDDDPELRDRFLRKITDEVDRLSAITSDLLVLSAAESNPVRHQGCNLVEIVQAVVGQTRPRAKSRGLALTCDTPDSLMIEANPSQLSQVVLNLLDNAINYTLEGSVMVRLKSDGDWASLMVEDTGIGISPEHHARLFERFYRVDKGRSRSSGGTGLGLSIVKHIVEGHGGTVIVESAPGAGARFIVKLPITVGPSE